MPPLRSADPDLRDLARGGSELIDAATGKSTGILLKRFLAAGGMASVMVAELDHARRSADLSPLAPRDLAIKIMKPGTVTDLASVGVDPASILAREAVALGRIMEHRPPCEFVVGFYGCGLVDVEVEEGSVVQLPWLALE